MLDATLVSREAADWVWVPPDADDVLTPDYRLTRYPDRVSVQWSATDRPLPEVVDEVLERVRAWNGASVRWWVNGRTRPADTAVVLERRGFRLVETVEVLALDRPAAEEAVDRLAVPPAVMVRVARTPAEIREAGEKAAVAFGWDPPTAAQLAEETAAAAEAERLGRWTVRRWLAAIDGRVVGSAGATLAGPALRLWGAGVLPTERGRGAYRALLAARCAALSEVGARFALVKGRSTTSAPILRRAGFRAFGVERCYQAPVAD